MIRITPQTISGNATEFDAVFGSHQGKHCKNGKSDAVTTEMTA